MELYQALVSINPVTLIAQICNLFIQLFFVRKFFLDKILDILDRRRAAADRQITDARNAKAEALAIRETYEQNMYQAKLQVNDLLDRAQKTANARSEEIIRQANKQAISIKVRAAADIEHDKKKALHDAMDEISDLAIAIAGKVVGRELSGADQSRLIDHFIEELGDGI